MQVIIGRGGEVSEKSITISNWGSLRWNVGDVYHLIPAAVSDKVLALWWSLAFSASVRRKLTTEVTPFEFTTHGMLKNTSSLMSYRPWKKGKMKEIKNFPNRSSVYPIQKAIFHPSKALQPSHQITWFRIASMKLNSGWNVFQEKKCPEFQFGKLI